MAALATAVVLAACGAAPSSAIPGSGIVVPPAGHPDVYVALGTSETAGVGLDDALRLRFVWSQLFYNEALSRASTYYNFAIPGITTADALQRELPQALAVHPTVATVFFTIDDLVQQVTPTAYEANLDTIVHSLRTAGATVLIAAAPHIDGLPAYNACVGVPGSTAKCPLPPGASLPPPAAVDVAIDAYDAAVQSVAARENGIIVDLRSRSYDITSHPEYISDDGLHPSALGDEQIANLFVAAYRAHAHA
ncbi:MAG: SGNH/GDSL hydrolase family protein [Candidatus Dormibacteraeota bacterium]|nr:SGNH/GDSL hydrolase family protein [Candidatus Dormibacteraeota bacterium]